MPRRTVVVVVLLVVSGLLGRGGSPRRRPPPTTCPSCATGLRSTRPWSTTSILPAQRWQAGNRGIDYGAGPGHPGRGGRRRRGRLLRSRGRRPARHGPPRRRPAHLLFVPRRDVGAHRPEGASRSAGRRGRRAGARRRAHPRRHLPRPRGAVRRHARAAGPSRAGRRGRPRPARRTPVARSTRCSTGAAAAVDYVRSHGEDWLDLVAHYATELDPVTHVGRAVDAARDWWDQLQDCTPASTPVPKPTGRRIAVRRQWPRHGQRRQLGLGDRHGHARLRRRRRRAVLLPGRPGTGDRASSRRPPPPRTDGPGALDLVATADPGLDDIPVHEFTATDSQQIGRGVGRSVGGPPEPRSRRPSPACRST